LPTCTSVKVSKCRIVDQINSGIGLLFGEFFCCLRLLFSLLLFAFYFFINKKKML
jgi:hypothetical protein